ncbi:MAG: NADPH-dependent FMN reductase [Novosphingobium sp.]
MTESLTVAVLVGSLRAGSYNRKVAQELVARAGETLDCRFVAIDDLPLYNEDIETADPPAAWVRFRREIAASDGVLFVSPEYNRSVPGALKNAIDVGSRPPRQGVWNGKPAMIVTASPGAIGGFGSSQIIRQSLVAVGMPVLSQPEVYLSKVADLFDADGRMNAGTGDFLGKAMQAFAAWIAQFRD